MTFKQLLVFCLLWIIADTAYSESSQHKSLLHAYPTEEAGNPTDSPFMDYLKSIALKSVNYGKRVQVFGGSQSIRPETETAKALWKECLNLTVQSCGRGGAGYALDTTKWVNLSSDNGLEFHAGYNNVQSQVRYYAKADYDIYILWCSSNDYTLSLPIGDPEDYTEKDGYDESKLYTQCGGLNYCIKYLRELNPNATIYIFGSLKFFASEAGYNEKTTHTNYIGEKYYDYIQAQKKVAELQSIEFFDQYHIDINRQESQSIFYIQDKYHLSNEGYEAIAPFQIKFLIDQKPFDVLSNHEYKVNGISAHYDKLTNTILCSIPTKEVHDSVAIDIENGESQLYAELYGKYSTNLGVRGNELWPRVLVEKTKDGNLNVGCLDFTNLPMVFINVDGSSLSKLEYVSCKLAICNPFETKAQLKTYETNANIKFRGQTAQLFDKKNFLIALKDYAGLKKDTTILGMREDDKWILDAMFVDKSRMRNRLSFDIWNKISGKLSSDMIRNGTEGRFVEVILNGSYNGLYCLSDRIDRKLLGVKKVSQTDTALETRGIIFKCSQANTPTHFLLPCDIEPADTIEWADFSLEYPDENVTKDIWKPLTDLFNFNSQITTDPDYVYSHWKEWYYKDNAVDYPLFIMMMGACDNMMHNSYLSYHNIQKDKRVWLTPWDLDGTFGRDGNGNKIGSSVSQAFFTLRETQPLRTFFDSQKGDWYEMLYDRWNQLKTGVYHPDSIEECARIYLDQFVSSGAWRREYARWDSEEFPLSVSLQEEYDYMMQWYRNTYYYFDNLMQNSPVDIATARPVSSPANAIYDLAGRKLATIPQKGIYIKDGKKCIAKPTHTGLPHIFP